MPGVDFTTSACDGHVGVTLCGDLDVTGTAEAEAAITALMARGQSLILDRSALDFLDCSALGALLRALTGHDEVFWVHDSVATAVAGVASSRRRYPWRRLAVRTARPGRAAPSRTSTG